MKVLWGKLWFRILAAFIAGPVVMTTAVLAVVFVYIMVMQQGAATASDFLPPTNILAIMAGIECVMMLPPLIVSEISNRRRAPLPAGLSAIFIALMSALFMAGLMATVQLTERFSYAGNWQFGVTILAICYLASGAVSFAVVSPFIRRWRQRSATVSEIAETF